MMLLQESKSKYSAPEFLLQKKASGLLNLTTEKQVISEPKSLKEIMEKMGLVKK